METEKGNNKNHIRVPHIAIAVAGGFLIVLALATVYEYWRTRDGWCFRFTPDGRQTKLYGDDCWK